MTARRWLRRVHLALACLVGLLFAAIAASGSVIVFRAEIAQATAEPNDWDGATDIGFAAARDIARARRPDGELQILWFPTRARPFYEAAYHIGQERFAGHLRIHPADGRVLDRGGSEGGFLAWMERFHVDLHLGAVGAWLVRHATLLALALVVTGVALWWPGWRPRLWFALRRRAGLLTFDLHRVLGLAAAPVLLVCIVTGLAWAFPDAARHVAHWATLRAAPERQDPFAARSVPRAGAADADDEALLRDARSRAPVGSFLFYITFPVAADEARQVRMQRGYEPWPYGEVTRWFYDRHDGRLLASVDPAAMSGPDAFLERWTGPLHFGTVGGWPLMGLYTVAALVPAVLAITGTALWQRRRRRRAQAMAVRRSVREEDHVHAHA